MISSPSCRKEEDLVSPSKSFCLHGHSRRRGPRKYKPGRCLCCSRGFASTSTRLLSFRLTNSDGGDPQSGRYAVFPSRVVACDEELRNQLFGVNVVLTTCMRTSCPAFFQRSVYWHVGLSKSDSGLLYRKPWTSRRGDNSSRKRQSCGASWCCFQVLRENRADSPLVDNKSRNGGIDGRSPALYHALPMEVVNLGFVHATAVPNEEEDDDHCEEHNCTNDPTNDGWSIVAALWKARRTTMCQ